MKSVESPHYLTGGHYLNCAPRAKKEVINHRQTPFLQSNGKDYMWKISSARNKKNNLGYLIAIFYYRYIKVL